MSALQLLIRTLNVLAVVALVLVGAGAWLMSSEGAAVRAVAFVEARLRDRVPGLVIGGVEGTLADRVVLHDIEVRGAAEILTIERLELSWKPIGLAAGAAVFDRVEASGVVYRPAPHRGDAVSVSLDAPMPVVVRDAAIDVVRLHDGDEAAVFRNSELSGRWVGERLTIEELRTESAGLTLTGHGAATRRVEGRIVPQLEWTLEVRRPDGPVE